MKATLTNGRLELSGSLDLSTGRGFGNMSEGLPENFLDGNVADVCGTIAVRYWHPFVALSNKWSVAVSELAFYATGAEPCKLTKPAFRRLERVVRDYKSRMTNFNDGNANLARFVLKHAVKRAKSENLI